MSEETIAAGGHRRWWPDGTMMARLDERTRAELVSLVPGNDGGATPLAGRVTTAGPPPWPGG